MLFEAPEATDLIGAFVGYQVLRSIAAGNPALAPWRLGKCIALSGLGRVKEGTAMAAQNLDLSRRFGSPVNIAEALACAAGLATVGSERDEGPGSTPFKLPATILQISAAAS